MTFSDLMGSCLMFNVSKQILHLINCACFSYIQSIPVVNEEQRGDFSYIGNLMTKEFIGQQLILIIKFLDTNEEGGRYI